MIAVENGHEEIVRLLLGKENVDHNFPNGWGQTPLMTAVKNGHEEVVGLLLGKDNVDSR